MSTAIITAAPSTIGIDKLNREHPHYQACKSAWRDLSVLSSSGYKIRSSIDSILVKRPKERTDIFQQRASRATYQNLLGTISGWYGAKLFQREPQITDAQKSKWGDDYYTNFLADCDRAGTSFLNFYREEFKDWFVFGCSYTLVDLPKSSDAVPIDNRADEINNKLDYGYLVDISPLSVINWSEDEYGNLQWVVIKSEVVEQDDPFGSISTKDCWYIFNRSEYFRYEANKDDANNANGASTLYGPDGQRAASEQTKAKLVDSGPHALAKVGRVPVRRICMPEDLWLGNRVYLQLLDHFNQDNTFSWALFMANLAMPVIIGPFDPNTLVVSEVSAIHLPDKDSKFEWAEPSGVSFKHSADRLSSLREEIYRSCHLQAQGRSSTAVASSQSGYSKEMDMMPSSDMLNDYGGRLAAAMQLTLQDIVDARGDHETITPNVNGFVFETKPITEEIAIAQEYFDLGVDVPVAEKVVVRRVIAAIMDGEDEKSKEEAMLEVEDMQTQAEKQDAEQVLQQQAFAKSFNTLTNRSQSKTEIAAGAGTD